MRYGLVLLMLFAVLSFLNVLAAPAPEPVAILELGPPPKDWSMEKHGKFEIKRLAHPHGYLNQVWGMTKDLASVARLKDARPWLAKNLRVKEEAGGRRLHLTFSAGSRDEQVAILNALLKRYHYWNEDRIKLFESYIRRHEASIIDLEQRIASGQHPESADAYRKGIDELRSITIPNCREESARFKQFKVIKWAG